MAKRGAFIVLEGLDRSGKSTQLRRLVQRLQSSGVDAVACRFPDRSTTTGQMIDSYLTKKSELDDHAIHLLFSANRWERASSILADLKAGKTVVCDRYAFSGIVYSAVKGLSYKWCQAPDIGLPLPDLVLFLQLSPAVAAQRGGFGGERYETSEVQSGVRDLFTRVGEEVRRGGGAWEAVDAGGTEDDVAEVLYAKVQDAQGRLSPDVGTLWNDVAS